MPSNNLSKTKQKEIKELIEKGRSQGFLTIGEINDLLPTNLYDADQSVAKSYDAACTPDFYLFDADGKLYYRGRLDESRPKSETPLTGKDLRDAIDNMLAGNEAPKLQYPSGGCNIKWKK